MRCMHEASLYPRNCFLTLTYDENHLPKNMSLDYEHYQLFMKRLRDRFNYIGSDGVNKIRFYMCGEYGGERGRPHYHALLFNFDFDDKYPWRNKDGRVYYRSPVLDGLARYETDRSLVNNALWSYGTSEIGEFSYSAAAYVARYIMKKQVGKNAHEHYELYDFETGEIFDRKPEFCKSSNKPGIGAGWFAQHWKTDVFPQDFVVVDGQPRKVPRYYEKLLKRADPFLYDEVKFSRAENISEKALDNSTPDRLKVREACAEARLKSRSRNLD